MKLTERVAKWSTDRKMNCRIARAKHDSKRLLEKLEIDVLNCESRLEEYLAEHFNHELNLYPFVFEHYLSRKYALDEAKSQLELAKKEYKELFEDKK